MYRVMILFALGFAYHPFALTQLDYWEQRQVFFGDEAYVVGFDSSGNIYAGGDDGGGFYDYHDGGIYRSTDNGDTWYHKGLLNEFVISIVVDQSGSVYAGTAYRGIFKSVDSGDNWSTVNTGLTDLTIYDLAMGPQGELYAGTGPGSGVFYSSNGGANWLQRTVGLPNFRVSSLCIIADGTLFATLPGSGLYKSTDSGMTWAPSANGLTTIWTNIVRADPQNVLYVGTQAGVYRSTDDGDSWIQVNSGISDNLVFALCTTQQGDVFCGLLNAEVYRSTNQGNTWERVAYFATASIEFIAVNNSGHVFVANRDGTFRSIDNGGTWIHCGLPNADIRSVGSHPNGRIFGCRLDDILHYSEDRGLTWIPASGQAYNVSFLKTNSSGTLFAGSSDFHRSLDGGSTWELTGSGFPSSIEIISLVVDHRDYLFAGLDVYTSPPGYAGGGIYRSTDDGQTWDLLGFDMERIHAIAVTESGSILVFTGYPYFGGLFRSSDDGQTWEPLFFIASGAIESLCSIGGDTLLAGTIDEGIFRSTNDGESWNQVLLDPVTIRSFSYHPEGKVLAAADTSGVYLSNDNGYNWLLINSGLAGRKVTQLTFDATGYAVAATLGASIFVSTGRITSVREENGDLPLWSALQQNYPNPFNPSTTIRFSIPRSGEVSLRIFNLLGEEVATVVSGNRDAGTHTVEWDATGQPSGVYFYRLQAGEFVETRKLVLLR